MGIADCGDVAACLVCVHTAAVDQSIDLSFDDLVPSDPVTQAELNKCQYSIGKEAQKYLAKQSKSLQKCQDQRIKGTHADVCPNPLAAPGTPARKAFDAIDKAETKMFVKICKVCGGPDGTCDGTGDLTAAQIGFSSSCPAVTPPAGAPCAGTITTVQDIFGCVDCVADYKALCMDRLQVQQFTTYPVECNQ